MTRGEVGSQRLDFLIAGHIGNWPLLRPVVRMWMNHEGDQSAACLQFGRGDGVADIAEVGRLYDFYRSVWSSVMTLSIALFVAAGVLISSIVEVSTLNKVLIDTLVMPWGALAISAIVIMGLWFARGGLSVSVTTGRPARHGAVVTAAFNSDGSDFWISIGAGVFIYAIAVVSTLVA